jgi:hypothetical protein
MKHIHYKPTKLSILILYQKDSVTTKISKNGGKIWILNDRQKGFSERGKKVHFWKIHFQNLLQKSKNSNFAAIFVYIENKNGIHGFVLYGIM